MPFLRESKLLALAVSSGKRASALPGVPTTIEAGFLDAGFDFWIGLLVSRRTPNDVIVHIHQATERLTDTSAKEKLAKLGVDKMITTPEEFDARIAREVAIATTLAK